MEPRRFSEAEDARHEVTEIENEAIRIYDYKAHTKVLSSSW